LKEEGQQKVENITLGTNLGSIGKEQYPVKVSISSTLYVRIFCTNVISAAFSTYM
jgi:hypothetical protein